ncbi:Hpt domain-containing protein [Phenylobacterium deserti]|uniref:Hpt domain-containing protein n=1 Tax=Phenylobacterium deserti TaxID=1914756 RepID=A0A328AHK9_9CAUL|nr:Hpt domain-containing protein [Phenylobacterium deserti]RAK52844.1 Hpt domain-containing protein [Phenylobacterium deserti]
MSSFDGSEPVDFAYLEGFMAGDVGIVLEVLELFRQQATGWVESLDAPAQSRREVAHTIKGAGRGIGARTLGDLADVAEFGGEADVPALRAELIRVVAAIDAYRAAKSG